MFECRLESDHARTLGRAFAQHGMTELVARELPRISMVAQMKTETFERTSIVPPSDDSDTEGVSLALATAHALEAQGDLREAARWLRRAAEEAEKEGNDSRVVTLARAAADLMSRIDSRPAPGPVKPPPPKPAPWSLDGPPSARKS